MSHEEEYAAMQRPEFDENSNVGLLYKGVHGFLSRTASRSQDAAALHLQELSWRFQETNVNKVTGTSRMSTYAEWKHNVANKNK